MIYSKSIYIDSKKQSPLLHFVMHKKWAWVRHFFLSIVIAVNFRLLNIVELRKSAKFINLPFDILYIGNAVMAIIALLIIYINLYLLFPLLFKREKYFYYILSIFGLVVIFYLSNYFVQQINVQKFGKKSEYASSFSIMDFIETVMYPIIFIGSTTGYRLFKLWITDQEKFATLEKLQLNSELAQLKNQVNPHFLFNTLNNLHVLTKTNPEKASQIILGFSDVLRYQIYESQFDTVLLSTDLEIIEQYIELEKIRRDKINTSIIIEGEISGILIPPLLFINFVDNAIKHSNIRGESFINIFVRVKDNNLFFYIKNSKPTNKNNSENGGVGLINITKRLQLLFGNEHTLTINDEANYFEVSLIFPI